MRRNLRLMEVKKSPETSLYFTKSEWWKSISIFWEQSILENIENTENINETILEW